MDVTSKPKNGIQVASIGISILYSIRYCSYAFNAVEFLYPQSVLSSSNLDSLTKALGL